MGKSAIGPVSTTSRGLKVQTSCQRLTLGLSTLVHAEKLKKQEVTFLPAF